VPAENPWRATTLEWTTASPPPPGNFVETPVVTGHPYRYEEGEA
jgi:cytochrome c oxidase subunit 1